MYFLEFRRELPLAKLKAILTGKNEEKNKWISNPNLLDNAYFGNPVN